MRITIVGILVALARELMPSTVEKIKRHRWLSTLLFVVSLTLAVVMMFVGCASVNQKLNPESVYKRDIELTINGENFHGVAVPKKAPSYEIKIKARGKIDMLTIQSCHRMESFEEPSGGWFSSGKSFTYTYRPIAGIEDGRGCLLDIGAFEREKGRHSWATIDFQNEEQFPAFVSCDGQAFGASGVSICQAKSGTLQKIKFPERVKVSPDSERCNVMRAHDEKDFTFIMPPGECTYYFGTREGRFHRLTTIGYESILIRGGGN